MDLKHFIKASGLDFNAVASALFPEHAHPYHALWKLIKDDCKNLKTDQLITLSRLSNTPPEIILGYGWKGATLQGGGIELSSMGFYARYIGGASTYKLLRYGEELGTYDIDPMISVKGFLTTVKHRISEHLKHTENGIN